MRPFWGMLAAATCILASAPNASAANAPEHEAPPTRWHFGVRVGATAALADGLGYPIHFKEFGLGIDGALLANAAYRLGPRSHWFAQWMLVISRIHVRGRFADQVFSERFTYWEVMPFMLRYDRDGLAVSFGPWVGAVFPGKLTDHLNPIIAAAAVEMSYDFRAGPGAVTTALMIQPIFLPFAHPESSWMQPAIFSMGYEW